MRKEAAKDKGKRKLFRKKIKEAKKEQWRKFVEEGGDVWKIARIARNPFNLKERCGRLQGEDSEEVEEDDDKGKCRVFLKHNIICGLAAPEATPRPCKKNSPPSDETWDRVLRALSKTRNNSAPGPDGITWRLLKATKDTRLGRAVLDDLGQMAELGKGYYGEEGWSSMTMVMIVKPGQDHAKVKGWRPIVLLNMVGKLADKVIAQRLGERGELFHERPFAGRRGRGAIDSVMLMDELRREIGGEVYGRDIKSAFNFLDSEVVREVLAEYGDLWEYVDHFLRPREFEVGVDGRKIGKGTMVGGTPQGSPLSPALFTIYMSAMVWKAEKKLRETEEERRHKMETRGKKQERERTFIPLSYIDDVNSVRVGGPRKMDEALESAAKEYRLQWFRSKDWKNGVHLGVNINAKKHWKFRVGRAEAAFNAIRRLSRLPSEEKRMVVVGQLIPILTYGSHLHQELSEEAKRLARRFARWVAMGYKGSSENKIEDITGIGKLEVLTRIKRVRWAASVYARNEPELRPRAERILREELGGEEDVTLIWIGDKEGGPEVLRGEACQPKGTGYTDGSRINGQAAAAMAEDSIFLGSLATVMDAELLAKAGAWEEGYTKVKSDSQAAIKRCQNLASGAQEIRS